jgi:hypothetical protein
MLLFSGMARTFWLHKSLSTITDCDDDLVHEFDLDDVDNLILALKKAKELWGSE